MEVEKYTPKTYCRLCAKVKDVGKLIHLQQIVPKLQRLNQPFLAIASKWLPQNVCFVCVQSLDLCVQFIDNAEKAQNALMTIFPNKVEIEISEFRSEPEPCNSNNNEDLLSNNQQILNFRFKTEFNVEETDDKMCISRNNSPNCENDNKMFLNRQNLSNCETDDKISRHNSPNETDEISSKGSKVTSKGSKVTPKSSKVTTKSSKVTSKSKDSLKKAKNLSDTSSDDDDISNEGESESFEKVESWDDLQWVCYLCDHMFMSQTQLVEHSMSTHHNCTTYKCPGCVKRFIKLETFIKHVRKLHSKKLRLSCYVCSEVFDSNRKRVVHEKLHVQDCFTCTGCRSTFTTEEEFNAHVLSYYITRYDMNLKGLNLEPKCNICNEKFDSQFKLKKHLASNHKPKQPHICDQCGKTFPINAHLKNHMLTHNITKGFKCSLCPDSFKLPSSLNKHMIRHKGEKNHSCTECGKSFLFKSQLTMHLLTHSSVFPFKCDYCEKCFRLKAQLKTHLLQHTGFKPYKCQICEREFTGWPNYNKHMVRKHQIDKSKTKRTPQGVIRLANVM